MQSLKSGRNHLKPNNGSNECEDEKQPPETCRLMKENNAQERCSHRTDARPNGVGSAHRQMLTGFVQ